MTKMRLEKVQTRKSDPNKGSIIVFPSIIHFLFKPTNVRSIDERSHDGTL